MPSIWDDLAAIESAVDSINEGLFKIRQRMIRASSEMYGPPPEAGKAEPDIKPDVAPHVPPIAHVVIDPVVSVPAPPPVPAKPDIQPVVLTPPAQPVPHATLGVHATVFGNQADEKSGNWKQLFFSTFTPSPRSGIRDAFVALPSRQAGLRVEMQHARADGTPLGPWVGPIPVGDVGPWFDGTDGGGNIRAEYADPYWETRTRPKAETQRDSRGRKTNGAGIDLTPRAMAMVMHYAKSEWTIDALADDYWERPVGAKVNVRVIGPDNETRITPHFTLEEMSRSAVASKYGIDNTVPKSLMRNLKRLCEFLEAVRTHLGRGFSPNQAYRSEALTEPMRKEGYKPAANSVHSIALAADLPRTPEFFTAITKAAATWREPVLILLEATPEHIHIALDSVPRSEVKVRAGAALKQWETVGVVA